LTLGSYFLRLGQRADDHSLPLAVSIESASPHESQLVEGVLGHSFLDAFPARLIGDKSLMTATGWIVTWPTGTASRRSHRVGECAGARRRTVVLCAVTANVGESSDFSLGSITFVGW